MNIAGFNLVDLGVLFIVLFFIREGYRKGFFAMCLEIICFGLGIVLALLIYVPLSGQLMHFFEISRSYAKVLAFLFAWLLMEAVIPVLTIRLYQQLPISWLQSKWNSWLGVVPAVFEAELLCAFVVSLSLSFPLPIFLKQNILVSYSGQSMIRLTQNVELLTSEVFNKTGGESLSFLTIGQQNNEVIKLGFATEEIFPDPEAERQMFEMINTERRSIGLLPLLQDQSLTEVARKYAANMFKEGYFSHVSPNGHNVANRADEAGISYRIIGENLAFAPDVTIAHLGLMKSEYHRSNILSNQFSRIGIGVQNAGTQGMMFVQVFAN